MYKKSLSHFAWKCQYHIVFIPKYRKKRLYGQVWDDVRDIIRTLCNYKGVEIVEGAVCNVFDPRKIGRNSRIKHLQSRLPQEK